MRIYSQPLSLRVAPIQNGSSLIKTKFQPRLGWIDYYRETKLQYLFSNQSFLGRLKISLNMLLHDLINHTSATLRFFFFSFILDVDEKELSSINQLIFENNKSLWISRNAVLGGIDSEQIDETLEYDFFRRSKSFEIRIWKSQNSPNKLNLKNILNNSKWKVICLKELNRPFSKTIEYREFTNVRIHHGQCVTQDEFLVPLDDKYMLSNHSWPSINPKRLKNNIVLLNTTRIEEISTAIFIGYSKSWFHFIIEFLPRYLEIPKNLRKYPLILPSGVLPQISQMLRSFGFLNLIETAPFTEIYVSRLLTVTDFRQINSYHPKSRADDILRLRQHFSSVSDLGLKFEKGKSRKIVFARSKQLFRQVENMDELVKQLTKKGYEVINPESLSFIEQVKLMQQCKILVAESGAALTSLLFSQSSISVLELEQFSTESDGFWESYCRILSHSHLKLSSNKRITKHLRHKYFVNCDTVMKTLSNLEK